MFGFAASHTLSVSERVLTVDELEHWQAPERAHQAREAYASGNEVLYNKLKNNTGRNWDKSLGYGHLPAILAFTSYTGDVKNVAGCLANLNHLLVFDYDALKHVALPYEERHEQALALLRRMLQEGAYCGTLSASGVGFWVAYKYPDDINFDDHRVFKRYYSEMMAAVGTSYSIVFDPACCNVNRWRFLGVEPLMRGTGTKILPPPSEKAVKVSKQQAACTQYRDTRDLLSWLKATGQIIGEVKADGSYNVVCPWESEHSVSTGESECGWSPTKGFHCFHGSCAGRTFRDFLRKQFEFGFAADDPADTLTYRLLVSGVQADDIIAALQAQYRIDADEAKGLLRWAGRKKARLDSIEAGESPNGAQLAHDYFDGWTFDTTTERFYRPGTRPHPGIKAACEGYDEDTVIAMCFRDFPAGLVSRGQIIDEVQTVKKMQKFDGIVVRCQRLARAWDGKDYLTDFAERHFDHDPYLVTRWRKWLLGGAAMWLSPGVKHDTIFVVTGRGALQKTLFAERIACLTSGMPPCDLDISDHHDKDIDIQRAHTTIAQYEEVFGGSMTRREGENAKRTATRRQANIRAPYARGSSTYYFRSLQIASSNHPDALPSTDAEKRRYYIAPITTTLTESDAYLQQMLGQAVSMIEDYFRTSDGAKVLQGGYAVKRPPWMESDEELLETIARNSEHESADNLNLAIQHALDSITELAQDDHIFGAPATWAHYVMTGDATGLYHAIDKEPYRAFASLGHGSCCSEEAVLRRIKERVDCRKVYRTLPGASGRGWVITSEQLRLAFCHN